MAIPFISQVTPQYPGNALVNLQPITEGIDAIGKAYTKQKQRNALASLDTGGLPPSMVAIAQSYDDPEKGFALLGQGVLKKADIDAEIARQKAMMPLQFDMKRRLLELEYEKAHKLARMKQALESQDMQRRLSAIDQLGRPQQPAARPTPESQPWTPPAKPYGVITGALGIGETPTPAQELPRSTGMTFGATPAITTPLAATRQTMIPTPPPVAPSQEPPTPAPAFTPDQIRDAKIGLLFKQPKMAAEALIKDPFDGTKKRIDSEASLRKEFSSTAKTYIDVRDAYTRVKGVGAQAPSAAGDMSLIFAFMKMLDPGSVVREGEFATAQNAAGVPARIQNLWNRLLSGERLSPDQRLDFIKQADTIYKRQLGSYARLAKQYREIAKRYKLDPRNIIPDYELPDGGTPTAAPSAAPAATVPSARTPIIPRIGEIREHSSGKWRYKGGEPSNPSSWEKVQ